MQGWWVASQYGPNERVKRASAGHIEKQPNIRAWRLILSKSSPREIDRSVYRMYTQKHVGVPSIESTPKPHIQCRSLLTLNIFSSESSLNENLVEKRKKIWTGWYHFCLVVISPHHSRAISLQGKSDITLSISDITLCRWYHQVKYTGYINYISPFSGIYIFGHIHFRNMGKIWLLKNQGVPQKITLCFGGP